jgi:hypothetical protein
LIAPYIFLQAICDKMKVTSLGSLALKFVGLKYRGGVCVLAPSICFVWHLSHQMDHMMPLEPQLPSSSPFPFKPLGFHTWCHLCLKLTKMLAHVNEWDFDPMGIQQFN